MTLPSMNFGLGLAHVLMSLAVYDEAAVAFAKAKKGRSDHFWLRFARDGNFVINHAQMLFAKPTKRRVFTKHRNDQIDLQREE